MGEHFYGHVGGENRGDEEKMGMSGVKTYR